MSKIDLENPLEDLRELQKDTIALIEDFESFVDNYDFPSDKAKGIAQLSATALYAMHAGIVLFLDGVWRLGEEFEKHEGEKPPFMH